MKYQHVRRIFRDPFYVNCKKHYCIDCNEQLIKLKISKIVNSNSLEAEDFDFYTGDSYMLGNVKFIWTEFQCPKCKRQFKIEEMKQIEKKYSKRNSKKFFLISIFSLIFLLLFICVENLNNLVGESDRKSKLPVKYIYNESPFYVYCKKHACPECETRLKTNYDSVVMNSNSPEAENYDFSIAGGDSYLTGDVEFRISYFKCPKCEFAISFDEMKKREKEK